MRKHNFGDHDNGLSRSENGSSSRGLREIALDDRAPVAAPCRSMICEAATGKLYIVTETRAGRVNSKVPRPPKSVAPEPSKFIYFEYLAHRRLTRMSFGAWSIRTYPERNALGYSKLIEYVTKTIRVARCRQPASPQEFRKKTNHKIIALGLEGAGGQGSRADHLCGR